MLSGAPQVRTVRSPPLLGGASRVQAGPSPPQLSCHFLTHLLPPIYNAQLRHGDIRLNLLPWLAMRQTHFLWRGDSRPPAAARASCFRSQRRGRSESAAPLAEPLRKAASDWLQLGCSSLPEDASRCLPQAKLTAHLGRKETANTCLRTFLCQRLTESSLVKVVS